VQLHAFCDAKMTTGFIVLSKWSLPSSRCHHSHSSKIGCWELRRSRAASGTEHRNM